MFSDHLKSLFQKDAKVFVKKFGRPVIEIDYEMLEYLCMIQCTLVEIAGCFKCSEDTIERRVKEKYNMTFAEFYKRYSGFGKASLRRQQFLEAMKGNTKLLIFLGQNYLDQSTKAENKNNNHNENINLDIDLSKLSDDELEAELNRVDNIINASKKADDIEPERA